MTGRLIILGAALILCASVTQVTFSHRTIAPITTPPTHTVEPTLPPDPCRIALLGTTKTFVADGKIFTNIYMKKVGYGVCKEEDRPYVYAQYYTPDGKPLPSSFLQVQELGKGSSPDKWGTIFNSIQSECTGLCQKYCTDPDAEYPRPRCEAEIVLFHTLPQNQQPASSGTSGSGLAGWLGIKIPPYPKGIGQSTPTNCADAKLDPLHFSLKFYQTLGDRRKALVKELEQMNHKPFSCSQAVDLPLK